MFRKSALVVVLLSALSLPSFADGREPRGIGREPGRVIGKIIARILKLVPNVDIPVGPRP